MDIETDYNTSRPNMRIREYGRNVQNLVEYALTIEDQDKKTKLAYIIISVMQQVNPTTNANEEYFKKLWNHLYIISDYKLDIEYPYEVSVHNNERKPIEPLGYSDNKIRYRFYGKNTELLLNNIAEEEPGEARDGLVTIIANQMKEMYITWNKNIVSDELIDTHIKVLTNDRLSIPEGVELISANVVLKKINSTLASKKPTNKGKSKSMSKGGGSKSYAKKPYQKGGSKPTNGGRRPAKPRR